MKLENLLDLVHKSKYPDIVAYNYLGKGEQYVIDQCPGGWQVFYYERGQKNNLHFFADLEEACDYVYKKVKQYLE